MVRWVAGACRVGIWWGGLKEEVLEGGLNSHSQAAPGPAGNLGTLSPVGHQEARSSSPSCAGLIRSTELCPPRTRPRARRGPQREPQVPLSGRSMGVPTVRSARSVAALRGSGAGEGREGWLILRWRVSAPVNFRPHSTSPKAADSFSRPPSPVRHVVQQGAAGAFAQAGKAPPLPGPSWRARQRCPALPWGGRSRPS